MMTNRTFPCPNSTSVFRNDLLDVPAALKALDEEIESLNAKIYLKMMTANGNFLCPNSNPPDFGNKESFLNTPWPSYHLPNDNCASLPPLPTAIGNWGFCQPALTMPMTRTASYGNYHYDFPLNSSLEPCSSTHFDYACSREEVEPSALANNFPLIPATFESTSSSSSSSRNVVVAAEPDLGFLDGDPFSAEDADGFLNISGDDCEVSDDAARFINKQPVTTVSVSSDNTSAINDVDMSDGNHVVVADGCLGFLDDSDFSLMSPRQLESLMDSLGDSFFSSDAGVPVTTVNVVSENISASIDVEMSDNNKPEVEDVDAVSLYTSAGSDAQMSGDNNDNVMLAPADLSFLDDFCFRMSSPPRQIESLMGSPDDDAFAFMNFSWDDYQISVDEEEAELFLW